MIAGPTYEIIQGVRRAKAFQLAGKTTIRAVVQNPDGTESPEMEVMIDSLRSPHKSDIDMSTSVQANRFWSIWKTLQSGKDDRLPAIVIRHGSKGKMIQDIGWTY